MMKICLFQAQPGLCWGNGLEHKTKIFCQKNVFFEQGAEQTCAT